MAPASLRLFVALYPTHEVTRALLRAAERLELPPRRAVAPGLVHMTIQFIGDTPARDVDEVTESVLRSVAGLKAFALTAQRLMTLPERGPARLIAAETERDPTLLELKQRLATRLARRVKPEGRDFRPHITLARFRQPGAAARVDRPLAAGEGPWAFPVSRILLMRSDLRPEGALHREVAAAPLE